jgi:hypothetical protein
MACHGRLSRCNTSKHWHLRLLRYLVMDLLGPEAILTVAEIAAPSRRPEGAEHSRMCSTSKHRGLHLLRRVAMVLL